MKKRLLIIGAEDIEKHKCVKIIEGKTEIKQLNSIVYHNETIVIPSSYLRCPWMTRHIIAMQQNAYGALMLLHANRDYRIYSPNFANVFRIPTIGIIISEETTPSKGLDDCFEELKKACIKEIIYMDMDSKEDYKKILKKIRLIKEGNQ